jgi:hypothetical protein
MLILLFQVKDKGLNGSLFDWLHFAFNQKCRVQHLLFTSEDKGPNGSLGAWLHFAFNQKCRVLDYDCAWSLD